MIRLCSTSRALLFFYREESENATELAVADVAQSAAVTPSGMDALGVQGVQLGRAIRTFDDACVHTLCLQNLVFLILI